MAYKKDNPGAVAVVLTCIVALFLGFVVWPFIFMLAWNAVVPVAFNGPRLDFIEAFALVFVVNALVGGLRRARS